MLSALLLALGFIQEAGEGTGNEGDPSAETKNTDTSPEGPQIPKARFDEVNGRLKELAAKVAAYEANEAKSEEQRLADQKKWEELAQKATAERDTLQTQLREFERKEKFSAAALAAKIPADRIMDAYRLAEFGEGEPDFPVLVTDLVKTRPWLVGEPVVPVPNAESGKGATAANGTPEQVKRQKAVQAGAQYLPRDMSLPARKE